jgi:peptidoglycan/LPS O-acetylase OafA/YrhL
MRGGFIGVDIFFVISGFLISTIILENVGTESFSYIHFYVRRIKRIFRALVIVLIASLAAGWLLLFADENKALCRHVLAASAFVSNFALRRESGYFDTADAKPLLHCGPSPSKSRST